MCNQHLNNFLSLSTCLCLLQGSAGLECGSTAVAVFWCVLSSVLSFFLPFWNLLGFFPLTSIAYRRVIRVYQYEVGDDLSGRFFPLIFLPHFGFQMHSLIPRLAFLPTNFHGLEMLGGFVSLLVLSTVGSQLPAQGSGRALHL